MERRNFIKGAALAGTGAALAAPAYAQGKRTLTMVTSVPEGFAVFDDAAQNFVDRVNAMSDGQLTIDKKPAGELVGAFEVFDPPCALHFVERKKSYRNPAIETERPMVRTSSDCSPPMKPFGHRRSSPGSCWGKS